MGFGDTEGSTLRYLTRPNTEVFAHARQEWRLGAHQIPPSDRQGLEWTAVPVLGRDKVLRQDPREMPPFKGHVYRPGTFPPPSQAVLDHLSHQFSPKQPHHRESGFVVVGDGGGLVEG